MQEVDESAPGIWKRLMTSASPEEFFENLDSIEKMDVCKWKEKRCILLRQRIQEEVEAELETDISLSRESTPFIRVKVQSVHPSQKEEEALLTIWEPTEEQLNILKEGTFFQMQNTAVRESSYDGLLQLTASTRTAIESIDLNIALRSQIGYESRRFFSIIQIHALSLKVLSNSSTDSKVRCPDADTVVVHVQTIAPPSASAEGYRIYVTDQSQLMLRIHCDTLPIGLERASSSSKKEGFRVISFCDLRIQAFDYDEDCAVARYCDTSSIPKTAPRSKALEKWVALSRGGCLRRFSIYSAANVPLCERMSRLVALGYIVDLKLVSSEKVHIEVDCGTSEVEEWELPVHLLADMLPLTNGDQDVSLLPEEETRVTELGVLSSIFRARGILWRFLLQRKADNATSTCQYVVAKASAADKRALGNMYGSMS